MKPEAKIEAYDAIVARLTGIMTNYLQPGGLAEAEALSEMFEILDGPELRDLRKTRTS